MASRTPENSLYFGESYYREKSARTDPFRQARPMVGSPLGGLTNRASTNSPVKFQTQRNYSQTFTGPIQMNPDLQRGARNQGYAQAAYAGNPRGFQGQTQRQGVQANNRMQQYNAGLMADAEASKAMAATQKQQLTDASEDAAAVLAFQERQAGEQGWLRDLLLDRDDINYRTQMAEYKREVDRDLAARQREVQNEISARQREAMIMGSMFRGLGVGLLGAFI